MKLRHINSLALICSALAFTGCGENSWNNTFLDGFQDGANYDNTVTVSYELTAADYQSIGQSLYSMATTDEEKAAANSIRNNYYFDQSSPYPIEMALPMFLDKEKTNFYIYNPGSHVQVSLAVAQGVPQELTNISAAPRMILPTQASSSEIISKLSQTYPDAKEGKYVVVSYENSVSTRSSYQVTPSKGQFIYNPVRSSRAESVWTVSEALAQMDNGFTGTATVKGVITNVKSINTSYGEIDYYIADAPGGEELYVYGGLGLNGEKFTSIDQLSVGDEVVVEGELKIYNNVKEFNYGSKILSLNSNGSSGGGNTGGDSGDGDNSGNGGDNPGSGGNNPNPGSGMNNLTSKIKDLAEGMELSATAMVTAIGTNGMVLSDNGGSILYYNENIDVKEYPVGTVVRVNGVVSVNASSYQLTDSASILVVGEGSYIYPTAAAYNASMIDAACSSTNTVYPTYVSVEGVVNKTSNSVIVTIAGTSAKAIFYPISSISNQIKDGDYYKVTGYYINTTGNSTKYFNMIATSAVASAPTIEELNTTNVLYTFNGTTWEAAPNATVLSPSAYSQMGFNMNELSEPKLYLPNYMKQAFPYALKDTEMFVAYNLTNTGCACSLLIFDGTEWTVNDNFLYNKVADFVKNSTGYTFSKYIGEELYKLYDADKIALNCSYLIVYNNLCMEPVPNGKTYGYPGEKEVDINDGTIVMTNGDNAFSFVTTTEYNGNTYTAPDGYFMILDSNGRYMYLQGTYSSFNVRSNNAYIENDGTINPGYLFTATKNEDGTWSIVNTQDIVRTLYYSDGNNDFAAYTTDQLSKYAGKLPFLYISDSSVIEDDSTSEE